jgi:hypothetical protein
MSQRPMRGAAPLFSLAHDLAPIILPPAPARNPAPAPSTRRGRPRASVRLNLPRRVRIFAHLRRLGAMRFNQEQLVPVGIAKPEHGRLGFGLLNSADTALDR